MFRYYRYFLIFFLGLDLFLFGAYVSYIDVGYPYGINPKAFTFHTPKGLYPYYVRGFNSSMFYIVDEKDFTLAFFKCSDSDDESLDYLLTAIGYSVNSNGELYVKCVDKNGHTVLIHPLENSSESPEFEEVSSFPSDEYYVQINGNESLLNRLNTIRRYVFFAFLANSICIIIFILLVIIGKIKKRR